MTVRIQLYRTIFLLVFAFCFASENGYAQHFNFRQISVEQGLPRSGVYSLLQDNEGFLWATLDGGGVAKYDGINFKTYDLNDGLPSRKVRTIIQHKDGSIWVGTAKGLAKIQQDKIVSFTTKDGLPHNYIRSLAQNNEGEIIIGTNKGLAKHNLADDSFSGILLNDTLLSTKIRVLYNDETENKVWVGTEKGVFIYKNSKLTPWKFNTLLPSLKVLSFLRDSQSQMWVGTQEGLVKVMRDSVLIYNSNNGLISNRVRAICEDNKGDLWIGTRTGVSRFDGNEFLNFNKQNGLSHERIRDILLDNNGTLWFATYYGGINNFNPNDFITYTTQEGLISNQILSLTQRNDSIIMGSFDGVSVSKFNNSLIDTIRHYTVLEGLPHNRAFCVYNDSHDVVWIGTKKGIALTRDFKTFNLISQKNGLKGKEVFSILQENSTTYWIGTDEGLNKITFNHFPYSYIITQHNDASIDADALDVSSIAKDNEGNIWVGYKHGGVRIKRLKGGVISPKFSEPVENVNSIVYSNGNLYISSDANGIFVIESFNINDVIPVKHITVNEGLSSNNIYAIAIRKKNELWCGSEKGVDKITLKGTEITSIEHFEKTEGIEGGEIIERSILFTRDNKLLLGTVNGLAVSAPFDYRTDYNPPILKLLKWESFTADNDKKIIWTDSINKEIPYYQNNIAVEFIGIDLNKPQKVKYKWFLEGFSTKWSSPNKRNYITFTNLPPKKYNLKIVSANSKGVWNKEPLSIQFSVLPPFWMQWWFIALVFATIIGAIILFVRWKINKLIEQRKKLEQKIAEATATIKKEKQLIEVQNKKISEQHQEIKSSIEYAQLIQEASLPENKIEDFFPDSFLLYRPRDVVSGDFYWWQKKNEFTLFCVADSTGHGIPGAFISLIGTILSNEIFYAKKLVHPNTILDELNKKVQFTLEQHLPNPKIKDGMDLSFCSLNEESNTLYFAGANNPVWIVRHTSVPLVHNQEEISPSYINPETNSHLFEIKGDKQPIGLHAQKQKPFTLHEIQLQEGDEVYLFTDGYADQFGGEKNKKFMSKRFKKLLSSNESVPMSKIRQLIELNFITWKGDNEQVDDVCVVGIRV